MEKLKNGDFCENLTKEQFDELIEIEDSKVIYLKYDEKHNSLGVYLIKNPVLVNAFFEQINLLSFEDFKNRAINTFKK